VLRDVKLYTKGEEVPVRAPIKPQEVRNCIL
jgi:hypothetical protein